jgi:hypothetical protein
MAVARAVLWLCLLTFAASGFAFSIFPRPMAALAEIDLPTDTARVDFVATYGGFELGFAAFLWVCVRRDDRVRIGLLASGFALGGFAAARLAGLLASGPVRPLQYVILAAEAVGIVLAFWSARRIESVSA